MKLSVLLSVHHKEILSEWDKFASTHSPSNASHTSCGLRDHAHQLLKAIAKDMVSHQSDKQQSAKSQGDRPRQEGIVAAAVAHGTMRQSSGFTLSQIAAEFRALRASVLRLWLLHIKEMTEEISYEMIRFNEAIDEALSESIASYAAETARIRDTFLAVLGHDLRSPLHVMAMAGHFLKKTNTASDAIHEAGSRIVTSTASMNLMVNDLLEYGRTQLGGSFCIKRHIVDMQRICQSVMDEAQFVHPECVFVLHPSGELVGPFDEARLHQVFSNLLNNAAHYCAPQEPIEMIVQGESDVIEVKVHNVGPVIPHKSLQSIFNPLTQLSAKAEQTNSFCHSAGLGLFIAREITHAHGGTIKAESSKKLGTVFTVQLPRTYEDKQPIPELTV